MNIFEKMLAITSELSRVAKNLTVGEGKNKYRAVGEADVLAAVKPLEEKYKVYSYPHTREIVESDLITTKKKYNNELVESAKFFMRVHTVYRFVNIENPDEFIDIDTYGDGIDSADKSPGKAMTYGDKYALLKAYKIITGDDPDQDPSEPDGYSRVSEPKCDMCGAIIKSIRNNGVVYSPTQIAENTKKTHGKCLCWECASKATGGKNNG